MKINNRKFFKKGLTKKNLCDIITESKILGHRQAVRQRTLTPSLPRFESQCPSQRKGHLRVSFLRWLGHSSLQSLLRKRSDAELGSHSSRKPMGARSREARRRILAAGEYPSARHSRSGIRFAFPARRSGSSLTRAASKNLHAKREYPSARQSRSGIRFAFAARRQNIFCRAGVYSRRFVFHRLFSAGASPRPTIKRRACESSPQASTLVPKTDSRGRLSLQLNV